MDIEKILRKSLKDYRNSIWIWTVIAVISELITIAFTTIQNPFIKELENNENIDIEKFLYFMILSFVISIITYMFSVGIIKCGLESSRGRKLKISQLFFAFRVKPLKFLCLYIVVTFYVILWSLLLIIPGIIKGISYSQAFNLMVENPDYGIREVIEESKLLMNGYKLIFGIIILLSVAFITLISLVPVVGTILVGVLLTPILNLVYVNFYNEITAYQYDN